MDPLTALSIAAATAQFIDFGLKTCALCKQIRDSTTDQTRYHAELQQSIKSLKDIKKGVTLDSYPRDASRSLRQTTQDCAASATELETLLGEFRSIAKMKHFGTLRASLRALKDQKKVEKLQNKLQKCQERFHAAVSVDTREKVLELLKEQGKTNDRIERVLIPEVQSMHLESSKAHDITHSKLTSLETAQKASNDAIIKGQARDHQESSEAHAVTHSKLARLESSQKASDQDIQQHQAEIRQEMHGRFDDAEHDAQSSSLHMSFLKSLKYPDMFARHQSIGPPSSSTYEWILTADAPHEPWWNEERIARDREIRRGFRRWLQSEGQIFWINGKAGSGKSSLMSFIEGDQRTKEALKVWAVDRSLHIFSFFFWRPGSELQKSIVGLLMSLLYQLVKEKPTVIESIISDDSSTRHSSVWTEARLLRALELAFQSYKDECVFCLIDGLDEFEGQYTTLLDTLFSMQHTSIMKLCVSSRPETALFKRLRHFPSLRLQDLNYQDIKTFAKAQFATLGDSSDRRKLIDDVAVRAEGIFLWAALVCKSLISGHDANDDEKMLQQRLDAIPSGLKAVFNHMFSNLDEVHHRNLSVYFCLLKWKLDLDLDGISVALITALLHPQSFKSLQDFSDACGVWQARVVAQCRGLVEIRTGYYAHTHPKWAIREISTGNVRHKFLEQDQIPQTEDYTTSYLNWVHRSAYDCILGDSRDGPVPWLADVDERSLAHKVLVACLWVMQYIPRDLVDFYGHYSSGCFKSEIGFFRDIATSTLVDSPESVCHQLDELYDTLLSSFYEENGNINHVLHSLFEHAAKSDDQRMPVVLASSKHFELLSDSPLISFWTLLSDGFDDYIVSRFERIKTSPYGFSICAQVFAYSWQRGYPSFNPGLTKAVSLLQEKPGSHRHFAMVMDTMRDSKPWRMKSAQLITWLGHKGEDAGVAAWAILSSIRRAKARFKDESWRSSYWAIVDAWQLSAGEISTREADGSLQALPLQLAMPWHQATQWLDSGFGPRRSVASTARIMIVNSADWPTESSRPVTLADTLLANHEDCHVLACFDLSVRSTENLLTYSKNEYEPFRFTGTAKNYAECLENMVTEIWANCGQQLDAWQQLHLLACVKKWFVEFWTIRERVDEEGSSEEDSDEEGSWESEDAEEESCEEEQSCESGGDDEGSDDQDDKDGENIREGVSTEKREMEAAGG
ncbi:hypothetical protein Q7P37_010942 [Cladosporium fusiforme]